MEIKINENLKPRIWVVDDFYDDPLYVREFALKQPFFDGGFGKGFIGRRTQRQYLFPGLKEKFEQIMQIKITKWEQHETNGRFQSCWAGEPLVYHCDDQTWSAMLYLTPNAPVQCGTTFFAHKQTQIRHKSHPQIFDRVFYTGTFLDKTPYEPVDVVGNVFNRLVIADAGLIHSASDYFGSTLQNGRLWQMFFFD